MILPSKYLKPDRALLSVGGEILSVLGDTATVSEIWDKVRARRADQSGETPLPFDWFILALSLLYAVGAVDHVDGAVIRTTAR